MAGVLEVIKNKVPQCTEMVDGLLSAVRQSQVLVHVYTQRWLREVGGEEGGGGVGGGREGDGRGG